MISPLTPGVIDNVDPTLRHIEFAMMSKDPALYSQTLQSSSSTETVAGTNFVVTPTAPMIPFQVYGNTTPSATVTNNGTIGTPPVLTINGPTSAPKVTNATTGKTMSFPSLTLASGEKLVYVRLFAGSLAVRQRVALRRHDAFGAMEQIEERITGIDRFASGTAAPAEVASAGEIAGLHGLRAARIGDRIGADETGAGEIARAFPAPTLESVVRPVEPDQITRLRAALDQLAEHDPLISLRQRNDEGEISIRLYGEVQKEVVMETLARDYGVAVTFGPSQTICIERPVGTGAHAEIIFADGNPFYATVGFRVESAGRRSGIRYVRELGALPLAFYRAIEETVYETLTQGLSGWEVTDAVVTLTHVGMCPISTAADFRKLTPLVLIQALLVAGTEVCEPVEEFDLDIPEDTFGAVCGALVNARATMRNAFRDGASYRIICEIPTAELRAIEQQLPALTRGDGSWVSSFAGHIPVSGDAPIRARIGPQPLNRAHYLADVARS